MNRDDILRKNLEDIICSVRNAKRVYRDQGRDAILRQPELLPFLLEYLYSENKNQSIKSAWILELVCLYEIRLLLPYLPEFTSKLISLDQESAIRPVSKVCALLSDYYIKNPGIDLNEETRWKNNIIEASFQWLTGQHKIAAQVFAMESLYLLGQDSDWILDELFSILDKEYPNGSSGYQTRARKIMDKILAAQRKKT